MLFDRWNDANLRYFDGCGKQNFSFSFGVILVATPKLHQMEKLKWFLLQPCKWCELVLFHQLNPTKHQFLIIFQLIEIGKEWGSNNDDPVDAGGSRMDVKIFNRELQITNFNIIILITSIQFLCCNLFNHSNLFLNIKIYMMWFNKYSLHYFSLQVWVIRRKWI